MILSENRFPLFGIMRRSPKTPLEGLAKSPPGLMFRGLFSDGGWWSPGRAIQLPNCPRRACPGDPDKARKAVPT